MAAANPRRRAPAGASARKPIKTSVSVDVELHARWSAAASLRGMDRNAFAVEALRAAVRNIIVINRDKSRADDSAPDVEIDRQDGAAA